MRKPTVFICAAAILLSLLLPACSKKAAARGDHSLEALRERGQLVLGLDDSFPPLGFRDENNEIVGYDIDLARELARRLGVELVCQPIDWSAKEQELNTFHIDCIWNGFTMTAERREAMAFTKPYLANAQVVVVRSGSGITDLAGLAGKVVGVQAGSSAEEAIEQNAAFKASLRKIVEFKENVTALNDLEIQNLDAVVMDQVVANYSIVQTSRPYVILPESLASEEYGVAFRKTDIALRDKVQTILEEMQADGTVPAISTKWFGADLSVIGK
ncbi:MAG TPA: amino acid ABC transporter substrate-binding protein [Treponema sp.]|nr:amino acid ABC transporter substrate-binding protein [Treponema sp.]